MVDESESIDDFKAIKDETANYMAQFGTYMTGRESIIGRKVKNGRMLMLKKRSMNSPPAELIIRTYEREQCLDAYHEAVEGIAKLLPVWEEKKDFKVFPKNGNSKYCKEFSCRAWGSDMCNQWQPKIK